MITTPSKVYASAHAAIADIPEGASIAVGGFGLCGVPHDTIAALHRRGVTGLELISNNCGTDDLGLGVLLKERQVARMISSCVGENRTFEGQLLAGQLELRLIPEGTLAEALRAGGAGIPAFYTPTGVGTPVADGCELRTFEDGPCVLGHAIVADFALVRAWRGDRLGNLVYRCTARNFNPLAAMAGRVTIPEVEELVDVGTLDADAVHTPAVFVQRVIQAERGPGYVERRTTRQVV